LVTLNERHFLGGFAPVALLRLFLTLFASISPSTIVLICAATSNNPF
jgi:hypothetical protein